MMIVDKTEIIDKGCKFREYTTTETNTERIMQIIYPRQILQIRYDDDDDNCIRMCDKTQWKTEYSWHFEVSHSRDENWL